MLKKGPHLCIAFSCLDMGAILGAASDRANYVDSQFGSMSKEIYKWEIYIWLLKGSWKRVL